MNVGLVLATCDFGSFQLTYPPSMTPTPPIPPITSYSSIFSTFLFEHSLLRVLPKKHDFFVGIVQMYANWGGDRKRKLFSATLDWRHPNRPIWGPWDKSGSFSFPLCCVLYNVVFFYWPQLHNFGRWKAVLKTKTTKLISRKHYFWLKIIVFFLVSIAESDNKKLSLRLDCPSLALLAGVGKAFSLSVFLNHFWSRNA